ncbi:MAG: hypothetical protein CVV11_19800 [Gammaproteobacteria bacterium HGW-Gammaproteobacteria-15]|nr:MAG: hypothetical protein CVV11_19800 [Gammaproteobacteria bacterium HGW-Gammaproteobacteria-15]
MTAIVLRFTRSGPGVVSPITLRFEGDEPPPPLPIQEPNLIMAVVSRYSVRAGHQQRHLKTSWASGDITAATRVRWSSNPAIIKLVYSIWTTAPLVTQQTRTAWTGNWPVVAQQTLFNWGGYQQVSASLKTPWAVWPVVSQQLQTTWLPTLKLQQLLSGHRWQQTDIAQQLLTLFYNHGGDITQANKMRWGPRPPSYICSQDARPTKGVVTLRFHTVGVPTSGVVTLRFSNANNPVVCELDIGGGLIPPLPDLPTIDTTQPITPTRRRSYIMQPQLRCYRVSDNQEINIISANWSISRSQWGATINLQCGSKGDKDLLFAGGIEQEFKLVINGYEFFGLAESFNYSGEFGSNSYTVVGRSSVAELASPHAPARSYSNATSKGVAALISDELTGTGWSYDFGMTQFNVPAGVFSYVNKTRIEAIAQIAAAIGGMVYPDGDTKTIHIRPQWPVTPWAIASATPAVSVHDDVILALNSSPASTPLFNAVFVRGEQQGQSAKVRRTGTAGDKLAADIVDPLMVDSQALRQRGTAELANSGRKDSVQLTLPIMDLLPPLIPGQVLGVTWQTETYKTLVDSVQITAQRGQNGTLTVRQNVGALRNYE